MNILNGKKVVFTGIPPITRADAVEMVKRAGAEIQTNFSKETDFLIIGRNYSASRLNVAQRKGIPTMTWEEFFRTSPPATLPDPPAMIRQFPPVSCKYGAPMGRAESHDKPAGRTVRLFRVRLDSGGYDDGGAYWGIGQPLYCATDGADYREFMRAAGRNEAAKALGIADKLIRR